MIGKLNVEVRFCPYTLTKTPTMGMERVAGTCYNDWVKVEQLNASRTLENAQITFSKAFKLTKRYYPTRPVLPDLTEVEYGSMVLSIHSVKPINEGRTTYEEILCYAANTTL